MVDRVRLRDVIDFHDDSTLATKVAKETCIQAVCTVMPNVEHMTHDEKLQILDMLGLIETRVPAGDIQRERNREKMRNQHEREKRNARNAKRRARRKAETGFTAGYSQAKSPEERKKPGPPKGVPYGPRKPKPVSDDELIKPVDPEEFCA